MKLKTATLTAALLAASFATAPVLAQQNVSGMSDLMTSMKAAKTEAGEIKSMGTVKSVEVIKIGDIAKAEEKTAIDHEITTNAQAVSELQNALMANSAVSAKLAEQNVDLTAVVAANAEADGTLKVYVR